MTSPTLFPKSYLAFRTLLRDGPLNIHAAGNLLAIADLESWRRRGRPITGASYMKHSGLLPMDLTGYLYYGVGRGELLRQRDPDYSGCLYALGAIPASALDSAASLSVDEEALLMEVRRQHLQSPPAMRVALVQRFIGLPAAGITVYHLDQADVGDICTA